MCSAQICVCFCLCLLNTLLNSLAAEIYLRYLCATKKSFSMGKITSQPKLWTSSFISICLVNLFIFLNFHALLPTFPFFITSLGGDAFAIGVAAALFSLATVFTRPFVGWIIDTRGRRTILLIGLVGLALMPLGYCIAAGISLTIILRTIHGMFHAVASNANSTWVADIVPRKRMGEGLGMHGLSLAISTAIAPAIGLSIMGAFGFRPLFVLTSISIVIAFCLTLFIRNKNYVLEKKPLRLTELFEPMSLPAAITQCLFMITYSTVEVFVAIYASKEGLPSGGIYFIFIAISTLITRVALGRFVDSHGEKLLVYTGNTSCIIAVLLLVFLHNLPCFIFSALFMGYGFGAIVPSLQTMAMHAVKPDRRGAATSTFFVAFDLGVAMGGFIAGILIENLGYDAMFLIIMFFCVLSLGYYYIFGRKHASSFNVSMRRATPLQSFEPEAQDEGVHLPLVVTISREFGSGGHLIGETLAKKMGVKFYDKELIALTAKKSGFDEATIQACEQSVDGIMMYDDPTQAAVFDAQSEVIKELVGQESCVIVGRLANFILKERPNCLNVFIYSNLSYRTKNISQKYEITTQEAEEIVKQTDKKRREHCFHFTGYEWGKFSNYHLMIDSSTLGYEGSANMIFSMAKGKEDNQQS